MKLFDLLAARRSVRQYTEEPVSRKALEKIVAAGLMAPSSKNLHSTELLVVEDRSVVKAMARCKPHFAQMLEQAPAAIVVMGRLDSHAWVEDASAALSAHGDDAPGNGTGAGKLLGPGAAHDSGKKGRRRTVPLVPSVPGRTAGVAGRGGSGSHPGPGPCAQKTAPSDAGGSLSGTGPLGKVLKGLRL